MHFSMSYTIPEIIELKRIPNMVAISGIEPEPIANLIIVVVWVIGQNVLMANPSHQTFYPHYVSRSKQLHHPRLKDSFPIDSSHSFADK